MWNKYEFFLCKMKLWIWLIPSLLPRHTWVRRSRISYRRHSQLEICLENNFQLLPTILKLPKILCVRPRANPMKKLVVKRIFIRRDKTRRVCVTYKIEDFVCLAFSNSADENPFLKGLNTLGKRRKIHTLVDEHQITISHKACAEAFLWSNIVLMLCIQLIRINILANMTM